MHKCEVNVAKSFDMKKPGIPMSRVFGAPDTGSSPAPEGDDEEKGETYHISAEQLKELNDTGTTQCDDGCTITADIGASNDAGEAGEPGAEGEA